MEAQTAHLAQLILEEVLVERYILLAVMAVLEL